MNYQKMFPIGTKVRITKQIRQFEEVTPCEGVVHYYASSALPIVTLSTGVKVYFDLREMLFLQKLDEFTPKLGDEIEYAFDGIPGWEKCFYVGKFNDSRHLVTTSNAVLSEYGDFEVFHADDIRPISEVKEYTMEELATLAGVPLKDFKIKGEK